ncbi:hypothetical protein HNR39_003984 [Glaciimonas immobilis]|uniref:Uncharacterized protein n=1 Tax=Glaciimonas immobilis TaxID=728004 RepID=A0A840S060_9BURK|nr:hypothetical protein [Glaciimonas immobilis]
MPLHRAESAVTKRHTKRSFLYAKREEEIFAYGFQLFVRTT